MVSGWLRLGVAAAMACITAVAGAAPDVASAPGATASGRLRLVTYNVAGLPEGISTSRPSVNHPLIGGLLNQYDLALIQEDFAYPLALRQGLKLAHASPPFVRGQRLDFGDGLSQFSRTPFVEYERVPWTDCHGVFEAYFDCLTPKGFTFSRQVLADGVAVDVYNLHMDAGSSPGDKRARALQLEQLGRAILARSHDRPLIVAGDFNLSRSEIDRLEALERATGATDVCRALGCPEPFRIDRVLTRSSAGMLLSPRSWRLDRRFVDARRRPLSDHLAVAVEIAWTTDRQKLASEGRTPADKRL